MKLLTKAILDKFEKTGRQENVKDPLVIAKFFNPAGSGTWLATEYDPETNIIFGVANIHETEWGYTSLTELAEYRGRFGLGIERDMHFTAKPLSQALSDNNMKLRGYN